MVQRETLVGYHGGRKHPFIQVTVALHSHVATLRRVLEKGVSFGPYGEQAFQTYESNIGIVLRFMIDVGIVGMGWLEVGRVLLPVPLPHPFFLLLRSFRCG